MEIQEKEVFINDEGYEVSKKEWFLGLKKDIDNDPNLKYWIGYVPAKTKNGIKHPKKNFIHYHVIGAHTLKDWMDKKQKLDPNGYDNDYDDEFLNFYIKHSV